MKLKAEKVRGEAYLLWAWAISSALAGTALFAFPHLFKLNQTWSAAGAILAVAWVGVTALGCRALLRPTKAKIISLVGLAITGRLLTLLFYQNAVHVATDAHTYHLMAQQILRGQEILISGFHALFPPFYSILLAGFGLVAGVNLSSVFALNTTIDLAVAATIYLVGKELKSDGLGLIAAWLYLIWPTGMLNAGVPQKDTLGILLTLQGVLAILRQRAALSWPESLRLGMAGGLVALTQPSLAPFLPCACIAFAPVLGWRKSAELALRAGPIAALVLLPWWVRNFDVLGAFVPFTTASGYSTLVAVTGSLDVFGPAQRLGEVEGAKEAARMAYQIAAADPAHVLYKRASAIGQAMLIEDWAVVRMPWMGLPVRLISLFAPVTQVFYVLTLAVAAWSVKQAPRYILLILLAAFVCLALFGVWFEFAERHRYFVMPYLFLLAAAGWRADYGTRSVRPTATLASEF